VRAWAVAGVEEQLALIVTREFKRLTGCPPHQYVVNRRLERARVLLGGGDQPIPEVALTVGFSSQSHLTAAFRRAYVITPPPTGTSGRRCDRQNLPRSVPDKSRRLSYQFLKDSSPSPWHRAGARTGTCRSYGGPADAARIGPRDVGAALVPGSTRALTF
jgi:AraC-like DNA-binding protein